MRGIALQWFNVKENVEGQTKKVADVTLPSTLVSAEPGLVLPDTFMNNWENMIKVFISKGNLDIASFKNRTALQQNMLLSIGKLQQIYTFLKANRFILESDGVLYLDYEFLKGFIEAPEAFPGIKSEFESLFPNVVTAGYFALHILENMFVGL